MKVTIKGWDVSMDIKNNGVEFEVGGKDGQVGDFYVTKTGVTWCEGKTQRENGKHVKWEKLRKLMKDL